jgi:hypothetical protein
MSNFHHSSPAPSIKLPQITSEVAKKFHEVAGDEDLACCSRTAPSFTLYAFAEAPAYPKVPTRGFLRPRFSEESSEWAGGQNLLPFVA